jgi:endonuclease/exonuclease/phosphatase family metal-dependent hydrolase
MKRLQPVPAAIILALALLLYGCTGQIYSEGQFTYPPQAPSEQPGAYETGPLADNATIRIASFNIQTFGRTKASRQDVMQVLAETISGFDIVAVQEIRDSSGTAIAQLEEAVDSLGKDYAVITGPRLGRTSSKEQYAFLYRTGTVQALGSYTYDDSEADLFHREPLTAYFRARSGDFTFVVLNIHVDPDEAADEIQAMQNAILDAARHFNEQDVMAVGDFNGDCGYFHESQLAELLPESRFLVIVPDSADTTVSATDCTYDRIIITSQADEDYCGRWGVCRFDTIHGLNMTQAKKVSDHYPVWAEFHVGMDTD